MYIIRALLFSSFQLIIIDIYSIYIYAIDDTVFGERRGVCPQAACILHKKRALMDFFFSSSKTGWVRVTQAQTIDRAMVKRVSLLLFR